MHINKICLKCKHSFNARIWKILSSGIIHSTNSFLSILMIEHLSSSIFCYYHGVGPLFPIDHRFV